jgi:hypothetical protein
MAGVVAASPLDMVLMGIAAESVLLGGGAGEQAVAVHIPKPPRQRKRRSPSRA